MDDKKPSTVSETPIVITATLIRNDLGVSLRTARVTAGNSGANNYLDRVVYSKSPDKRQRLVKALQDAMPELFEHVENRIAVVPPPPQPVATSELEKLD